jgi:hypothetical protein
MRKIFLTLFISGCGIVLNAQPILTQANFAPVIGESQLFYIADTNSIVDPTIGANVIFDYSGIHGYGATQTQYIIDPATTTFALDFLSATYADTTGGYPINKNYSKVEALDSITNIGMVADINTYGTVIVQYDQNPEILMKFPFNYNDSYVDSYAGLFTIQVSGTTTNGSGIATVDADAWGKLLLPYGVTIDSVLRVKTVESLITDTIFITFPIPLTIFPIEVNAEYINYYKPSINKFPLLSFISGSYTQDNNSLDSSRVIISQYPMPTVGIDNINESNLSLTLFPNPSNQEYSSLSFHLDKKANVKVGVINSVGKKIEDVFSGKLFKGENKLTIKTSNLSKGVYFVRINIDNNTIVKKLLID